MFFTWWKRLRSDPRGMDVKEARQRVIHKMTELILATADVLDAERREGSAECPDPMSLLHPDTIDPGLIRGFVRTPMYEWLTSEYLEGDAGEHILCKVAEILHELAPRVFRRPRY